MLLKVSIHESKSNHKIARNSRRECHTYGGGEKKQTNKNYKTVPKNIKRDVNKRERHTIHAYRYEGRDSVSERSVCHKFI